MGPQPTSRLISGRIPPPGTSPIADDIRARRGARGITPLDASLLHVPPVASGWNSLLGAIRTQGKLPGDVRELMILRVAAINGAAYEWVQHEEVGRACGLATDQLYVVRDTETPLPPSAGILSALQIAALAFADASTRRVKVGKEVTDALMENLEILAREQGVNDVEARKQDLYAEAALVVAAYNMVSRFLVSADVACLSDDEVPWPLERKEHFVSIPSVSGSEGHIIHAVTLVTTATAPWIVLANSLLTDLSMWGPLIPFLISSSPDPSSGRQRRPYNILVHSQRGHGRSTLPPPTLDPTTIPSLASDIEHVIKSLGINPPVHAVIGVSQGGAAALAIARTYHHLSRSIVVCDSSAKTPAGNKEAWAGRIGLAYGGLSADIVLGVEEEVLRNGELGKGRDYAKKVGMAKLAEVTIPRWFSWPSRCADGESERKERNDWLKKMVKGTEVDAFVAGARALSDYDLLQGDETSKELFDSPIERVLLVAGSLDGGGKVGNGLRILADQWNCARSKGDGAVEYVEIEGAGHLPMIDETEGFAEVLRKFLDLF